MKMDFWILLAITIAWWGWMTWLSHQTGEKTGRASRDLAYRLEKTLPFVRMDLETLNHLLRKGAHLMFFGGLAFWGGLTVQAAPVVLPSFPFFFVVALWAWGDEKTKVHIPGRHCSWVDVGFNLMGACLGAGLCWLLTR